MDDIPNSFMMGVNIFYSFEVEAWNAKNKKKPIAPVCFMTAGYLSGWLEQHFGLPLVAVEVGCAALGHDCCDFIVAHPDFVEPFVKIYLSGQDNSTDYVNTILSKFKNLTENRFGMVSWLSRLTNKSAQLRKK
eukprot:TRINITY_DN4663_c0_g1_i1.p1 TRINITY_DN4663_c0_g1~~TRINITY_DN4663_c0_g1_i1.p1  ORF type:complete len:133 (-),score=19.80 TRINITY_DN4663_c0_g1_i1:190-588(-)